MSIQLCSLGSGSKGNCTLVTSDSTRILIDAGLSARETTRRLLEVDTPADGLDGICVSHEHRDHTGGLRVLYRKHRTPLYANTGTIQGLSERDDKRELRWNVFTTGSPFTIGDLNITSFTVPHDAFEPVGFVISCGEDRIGIATDMGMATHVIRTQLKTCQAIVVESNHDEQMLQDAPRPWSLKQRIMGRQGHLSNFHAADMLGEIAGPQLQQVFLAHLSDDCNLPQLALRTAREKLEQAGQGHVRVSLTYPDRVSEVWRSSPIPA